MEEKKTKKNRKNIWKILVALLVFLNVIMVVLLVKAVPEKKCLEVQFSDNGGIRQVQQEIQITLPDIVYVANGITMELYHSQVTDLGEEISRYNVRWNCEIGENLERRFSVSANDENLGSYELIFEVYNNQLEIVAEKACTLVLVEADMEKREIANQIQQFADVPDNCLEQVLCGVDTEYNGTFDALKPEGLVQLQDIVYAVLCGNE